MVRMIIHIYLINLTIMNEGEKYTSHMGQYPVINLSYYGFEDKENIIKKWYNGYLFGECNVYKPWSVDKFICDLTGTTNALPISYWANTSSNSIVKSLIEKADDDVKAQIEELVSGKTIEKVIHEDITYADIDIQYLLNQNNINNLAIKFNF